MTRPPVTVVNARRQERFVALCSAEALAPASAKQARKGWSSHLRAKRWLAQACVARCRNKPDVAAAFLRAAAEAGCPPEDRDLLKAGDMELLEAERELPCRNRVGEHFVKGLPIPCSVQWLGAPFEPVFTV